MKAAFNARFIPPTPGRCWTLKVTLISAQNLPDVRKRLKMKVYAQVSVNGEQPVNTEVDTERERNPKWDSSFERVMAQGSALVVKLYCKRTLKRDRFVSKAEISMLELVQKWQCGDGDGELVLDLHNEEDADAWPHGKLNISYSFL